MPGIAGIISRQKSPDECQRLVASMTQSMMHESFYISGIQAFGQLGIYAGWVAHAGSLAAEQVFWNEQKNVALIFAGECFINDTARAELEHKGHNIDVAAGGWLVHLYEEKGEEFFELLNGLFSGLLIDKRESRAFLFNDRYGMERLYWRETPDATYFASEAKALLRVLPESRAFDEEGVAQFLKFGCTLDWKTLFRGVRLAPGGTLWTIESGQCHKKQYFTTAKWEGQARLGEATFEARFSETFQRILPNYFESESKIGISLTGGLDTRMIMACLPRAGEKSICYTFSGEDKVTLDSRLAARVSEACHLDHRIVWIGREFLSDFASHSDRTVYVTDGCFGILGAHEIYLNRRARQLAPIRLTGNFGSEVLRGISTFKPVDLSHDLFNAEFSRFVNPSVKELSVCKNHPVTFAAFREIPWSLFGSVAAGRSQLTFRTPYLDNELVALAYQAPEQLRQSSRPASRLVKASRAALSEIPTDRGFGGDNSGLEFLFRRVVAEVTFKIDYYNNEGLPRLLSPLDPTLRRIASKLGILGLHKYLPYRHWFRTELAGFLTERLANTQAQRMPFWDPDFLENMAKEHISGRRNYTPEINAVLTLEAVQRLLFNDLSKGTSDFDKLANEDREQESLLPT